MYNVVVHNYGNIGQDAGVLLWLEHAGSRREAAKIHDGITEHFTLVSVIEPAVLVYDCTEDPNVWHHLINDARRLGIAITLEGDKSGNSYKVSVGPCAPTKFDKMIQAIKAIREITAMEHKSPMGLKESKALVEQIGRGMSHEQHLNDLRDPSAARNLAAELGLPLKFSANVCLIDGAVLHKICESFRALLDNPNGPSAQERATSFLELLEGFIL